MWLVVLLALLAVPVSSLLQPRGRVLAPSPKTRLVEALRPLQRNGKDTTRDQRLAIDALARELERGNPTRSPARSAAMGGFWRMRYTSLETSPSAGQLGPLTGDVFQDLRPVQSSLRPYLSTSIIA